MAGAGAARVLIVDEDDHVRTFFDSLFVRLGYQVALAGSGRDAMGLLRNGAFDLVIAEHWPPRINGLMILRAARQEHPSGVRILSSAIEPDVTLREEARGVGCAVLLKPFHLEALISFLTSAGLPARGGIERAR